MMIKENEGVVHAIGRQRRKIVDMELVVSVPRSVTDDGVRPAAKYPHSVRFTRLQVALLNGVMYGLGRKPNLDAVLNERQREQVEYFHAQSRGYLSAIAELTMNRVVAGLLDEFLPQRDPSDLRRFLVRMFPRNPKDRVRLQVDYFRDLKISPLWMVDKLIEKGLLPPRFWDL